MIDPRYEATNLYVCQRCRNVTASRVKVIPPENHNAWCKACDDATPHSPLIITVCDGGPLLDVAVYACRPPEPRHTLPTLPPSVEADRAVGTSREVRADSAPDPASAGS